jgi:hypothetical protein
MERKERLPNIPKPTHNNNITTNGESNGESNGGRTMPSL